MPQPLDRLADALGLPLVKTVQLVQLSSPQGWPRKTPAATPVSASEGSTEAKAWWGARMRPALCRGRARVLAPSRADRGTRPRDLPNDGYSCALVVRAGQSRAGDIKEAMERIVGECWDRVTQVEGGSE